MARLCGSIAVELCIGTRVSCSRALAGKTGIWVGYLFRKGIFMSHPALLIIVSALATLISACSREASLYPSNATAGTGLIKAKFTDSGMGKGPIEITMPDGEVLKGEFSTTDNTTYGFGSGWASNGRTSAVASGSSTVVQGSKPGVATAIGPSGTTLRCDYAVNSFSGGGSGKCWTNKGAEYDLHF